MVHIVPLLNGIWKLALTNDMNYWRIQALLVAGQVRTRFYILNWCPAHIDWFLIFRPTFMLVSLCAFPSTTDVEVFSSAQVTSLGTRLNINFIPSSLRATPITKMHVHLYSYSIPNRRIFVLLPSESISLNSGSFLLISIPPKGKVWIF